MAEAEKQQDFGREPQATVERWRATVELYDKEYRAWRERAGNVVKRYRDERNKLTDSTRRFNILWSNVQTLKPAVYAKIPKPVVERRHLDKDPIGRLASQILQRTLSYMLDVNGFDKAMKQARDDYLLVARGVTWNRYEPVYGEETAGEDGQPYNPVADEKVCIDYVFWDDFGHEPARTWEEVTAVWRKVYLTRDKLINRFGEKIGKAVPLNHKPENMDDETVGRHGDTFKQAKVYEIWDKAAGEVLWVCFDYQSGPLDRMKAPVDVDGFFPCPEPLYASVTTDTLVPLPDYAQYQDQAAELDELTERISLLTKSLKLAGVYDGALKSTLDPLINDECENKLIPVDTWAALANKGGLKGVIDWLPVKEVADVLNQLTTQRQIVKQDLYEATGMADILRGASDASETATAQRIKGRFASLRLEDRQRQIATFARDNVRIIAEIVAEHFSPETLIRMSGAQELAEDPNLIPQAIALLKQDKARAFRIEIETDSTIEPDREEEKAARVEFLGTATSFMKEAIPAAQMYPALGPLLGQMLLFGVRGFRVGRGLESQFEQAIEQLQSQPPPDPNSGEMQAKQAELQARAQEGQQKLAFEQQKHEQTMAFEREKHQQTMMLEREKMTAGAMQQQQQLANEQARFDQEFGFKQQQAQTEQARFGEEFNLKRAAHNNQLIGQTGGMTNPADVPAMLQDMTMAKEHMEQALALLAQLAQQQAQQTQLLVTAIEKMTAPRQTRLITDASGMPIGGVSEPVTVN